MAFSSNISISPASTELMQIIYENCIKDNSSQSETMCHKASRIGLKILTFASAIGGAVPNIPLALKFGGTNLALGVSVASSNFITRTFLGTWSYHKIIDSELGLNGKIKRKISSNQLSVLARVAIKAAVFAVAFIAQTPRAYIAYNYNNHNIIYPILTYLALVAIPAYSLDLSLTRALELRKLSEFEHLLNKIKKDVKSKIQDCRSKVVKLSSSESSDFLLNLAGLSRQSPQSAVPAFFSDICKEESLPQEAQTTSQKVRGITSRILSGLTALSTTAAQTGVYFWIGVKGSQAVWDNPYFYYTAGSLILVSNLYLTSKVMISRSRKLFNQIFFKPLELLTGDSIISNLVPKARATAGVAALVLSALSTGTIVQNVIDYFGGELCSILKVLAPLSMFLLGHQAISDLIDEICILKIQFWHPSQAEQDVLNLDLKLEKLKFIIEKMSFKNFAKLLMVLPDDVFLAFIGDRISKSRLDRYITNSHRESSEETTPDEGNSFDEQNDILIGESTEEVANVESMEIDE